MFPLELLAAFGSPSVCFWQLLLLSCLRLGLCIMLHWREKGPEADQSPALPGDRLGCRRCPFCFWMCLLGLVQAVASRRTSWSTQARLGKFRNPSGAGLRPTGQLPPGNLPSSESGASEPQSTETCSIPPLCLASLHQTSYVAFFSLPCRLGCEMGTENPQAEQGLRLPLPGLLLPGGCYSAPEHPALTLVSPTQAGPK